MTIQQHASFDSSAAELNATSKLVKAWESKNAKNVAKAGGVSLMALSLAACGGSSTTTTTTTDTTATTDTTTVVAPVSSSLTIGVDTASGGAGDDSFAAGRSDTMQTWNSGDSVAGGEGTDTLTAVIQGDVTPAAGAVTGVENLIISSITADNTVTFSTAAATGISGVTHITNLGSTKDLTLTRVTELAEVTVNNVILGENTIITFADAVLAGSADTFTLNVNGALGGINVGTVTTASGGGIENLVINATGAKSTFSAADLDAAAATVTITGSADLDINGAAAFPKMTTFDASAATGDVDVLLGADTVTGTADAKTLTFGSGADDLDLGALAPAEIGVLTVAMGTGNDALDIDDFADATMVLDGGDGTDTLTTAAALTAANGTKISNFETFQVSGNVTQNMSLIVDEFDTITAAGAATSFTSVASATATLNLAAAATTSASFARLIDGTANSLTIATTGTVALTGDFTANEEETITIDSNAGAFQVGDTDGGMLVADLTSLIIVGDNNVDLIGDTVNADNYISSTKIASIDASGLTGTATFGVNASNATVAVTVTASASTGTNTIVTGTGADVVTAGGGILNATTGVGNDTITGGAKADIIVSGVGNDTINGGAGGDTITGGAGIDTIDLGAADGATDTVNLDIASASARDIISNFLVGATANNDVINTSTANDPTEDIAAATDVQTDNTTGNATLASTTGLFLIGADMAGDFGDTGTLDGTALLTALNGTITADSSGDIVIVAIDNGTDTGIYLGDSDTNTGLVAGELTLIAVLDGLADATTLTSDNFTT